MKKSRYKVGDVIITNCGAVRTIKEVKGRGYYYLHCLPEDESSNWVVTDDYIKLVPRTKLEKAMS